MPPKKRSDIENVVTEVLDLNLLFETDDENDEFFGFDLPVENVDTTFSDLREIFNNSNCDDDFAGFRTAPNNTDLNFVFSNDSYDAEFFGF